jgi:retinol dehydrogenase 12
VLILHNTKVYIASRNIEKSEAAIKELKDATGKDTIFLKLHLASLFAMLLEFFVVHMHLHLMIADKSTVSFQP